MRDVWQPLGKTQSSMRCWCNFLLVTERDSRQSKWKQPLRTSDEDRDLGGVGCARLKKTIRRCATGVTSSD